MRNEPNLRIENYRDNSHPMYQSEYGKNYGAFAVPTVHGYLKVLSSGFSDHDNPHGLGWEHVSVSMATRCPTWEEMCKIKELFWRDDETVVQFHPRKSRYVNRHPFCLHLWKLAESEYVLPPEILVG